MSDIEAFLASCEANTREILYRARWDEATAEEVVPLLIEALYSDDLEIKRRALSAFVTICHNAQTAAPQIIPLLRSADSRIYETAAHALQRVSWKKTGPAIQPLIEMAAIPGREKFAMHALIGLGPGAKAALPVFIRAFDDSTVYMRRLALRGLKEIGAEGKAVDEVLDRASRDRSKEIREYAKKVAASLKG